jgi:hypothetical protein
MSSQAAAAWEVFLEKIAEMLAVALTTDEADAVLGSLRRFADKVRERSRCAIPRVADVAQP